MAPTPDGGAVFAGSTSPNQSFTQSFVVKAAVQPAMPRIGAEFNAASQLGVALSPGETFIVRGAGFGSDAALLLNGRPVPLLAQTGVSLTAAVPPDFTAGGAVTITVQSGGSTSNQFLAQFLQASPGLFPANGSGVGQAYILNADGTVNSPANPAHEAEAIKIFATGVGPLTFDQGYAVTGTPVAVDIDGFWAPGIAAVLGPVNGLPGNGYQISVYVPRPSDFAAGNPNLLNFHLPPTVPVTLSVDGATSQYGLTLSVGQ